MPSFFLAPMELQMPCHIQKFTIWHDLFNHPFLGDHMGYCINYSKLVRTDPSLTTQYWSKHGHSHRMKYIFKAILAILDIHISMLMYTTTGTSPAWYRSDPLSFQYMSMRYVLKTHRQSLCQPRIHKPWLILQVVPPK